jgi:large conductance mechanosensitive channel
MLKGFRDFILRGNVIELAVGVVIGVAFGNVVTQFTKSFLEPLIKVCTGGKKVGGHFTINSVVFDYGAFLNAILSLLITAAVLYFLVIVPANKLNELRRRGQVEEPEPSKEVELLTQIRDALERQAPPASRPPNQY